MLIDTLHGQHDAPLLASLAAAGVTLPSLAEVNQWVAFGVGLCALALGIARLFYFFKEKWNGARQ